MRSLSPLLLMLAASCGGDRPHDVLLVCLDTVRADHLGCYGYATRPTSPTLDALAARGLRFADVTAASGWTKPSVPSFLTGTFPAEHGVYEGSAHDEEGARSDVLDDSLETLAETFRRAGYRTAAFVHNAQLRAGTGIEQGFERYQEQAGNARQIADAALGWLAERPAGGPPSFLYLHVLDAHWPYDVPDEAADRFASRQALERIRDGDWRSLRDRLNDGERTLSDGEREELLALYDASIRFVDDQLGRLLAGLDERGLGATVVAVVADHGEEFLEHGRLGHGHGLWENLTRVGWILAGPGIEAGVVETRASLVDLHPTLLAAAGLPAPEGSSRAIDRLARPDAAGPLLAEHKAPDAYTQSLREGRHKVVRRFRPPPSAAPAAAALLARGGRWEAELARGTGPLLRADQLKPREEPASDPTELKGVLSSWDGRALVLHGVSLAAAPDVELTGAATSAADLSPGRAVKARLEERDGALLVTRLKVYPAGEEPTAEVRGPVSHVALDAHGAGTIRIGPFEVTLDVHTTYEDLPDHSPLEREDVARLLEGGEQGALGQGFQVETSLFDLDADPGEQGPLEVVVGSTRHGSDALRRLAAALDREGRSLAVRRRWAPERAAVDDETLEELRALGYVR